MKKAKKTSGTLREALEAMSYHCSCADYCQCGQQLELDDVIAVLRRLRVDPDKVRKVALKEGK